MKRFCFREFNHFKFQYSVTTAWLFNLGRKLNCKASQILTKQQTVMDHKHNKRITSVVKKLYLVISFPKLRLQTTKMASVLTTIT